MLNNSNSMNMISCSQFIMFKTQIYFLLQSTKGSKQLSLLDPIVISGLFSKHKHVF
jgi:hypothetical protein